MKVLKKCSVMLEAGVPFLRRGQRARAPGARWSKITC
jgi:hypothetical protein